MPKLLIGWWAMQGSNLRPLPCESVEIPKQDAGHIRKINELSSRLAPSRNNIPRLSGVQVASKWRPRSPNFP